ncbi:MAG: hypothetical protein ACI91B_000539 [Planctomycetota bacterium]|jgi:hypothetical protein
MTSSRRSISRRQWVAIAILTLLTVSSVVTSAYCAVNRLDGYNYRLADYATIYVPHEAFSVVGVETTADTVKLRITGDVDDCELLGPAASAMEFADGALHLTGIPKGTHTFRISSKGRPDLRPEFSISGGSRAKQVTSSSVLIGRFARESIKDLATQREDYGREDIQRATARLSENSVVAGDSSLGTLQNLWMWLYPELESGRGVPPDPDWLRDLPAYAQYEALVEGKAAGYCTHMAEVHNLFGTAAGLAMRVVDVNGRLDGVNLTNHTFNEVWIPEQERWAYSDLQAGVLFVRDTNSNSVVNAVQICQLTQAGATGSLMATTYDSKTKTIVDIPYELTNPWCRVLLHPSVTFVYHRYYRDRGSFTAWLDRYLINPELAYMMQSGNSKHLIKMGAFGVLALCISVWCFVAVRMFRSRRSPD